MSTAPRQTTTSEPADRAVTLLGVDLGTASVKVVLVDLQGQVLASENRPYDVCHPHPGWSETDPQQWWLAAADATRAVVASSGARPVGVGLSGQMHGVVLTGADGVPVRPAILWSDSRTEAQLDGYRALPDAARARLGNPAVAGMAGPSLAWLARHEPHSLDAAAWALQPKDWVRLQLTGEVATEPSDASATLLWDLVADRWDTEVVAAMGVDPDLLAPVLPSSKAPAGHLTARAADLFGLPAGIPVAAGGGDTAVAMFGSGLVEAGAAQLTIGTGIQVVSPMATLPEVLPADPVTHLYRTVEAQGWYAMAASLNGGSTLAWVCRVLGLDWAELYAAAALPARDDDPLFLPLLHGERTPYLDSSLTGSWTGLRPSHDRDRLARSALEGVALATRVAVESLDLPDATSSLRRAGGGTRHPDWRQLLADTLGRPLDVMDVSGASGLGAALLAADAAGVEPTVAEQTSLVRCLPREEGTARAVVRGARYAEQVERSRAPR